ncbi:hypothetical protein [Clostridium sp.]|jgi:hypothetical protein|uniref:hypothetical protein n=1 Tax=Clostridium sp. TaxID=1506 RepID=UPI002FDCA314
MEKPVLFNTEMVNAILNGKKISTRRPIKPQPPEWAEEFGFTFFTPDRHISYRGNSKCGYGESSIKMPYCKDDILYVRETWASCKNEKPKIAIPADYKDVLYFYKADDIRNSDGSTIKWHPSIHMPKVATRIFLKVTDVKVQRIQDITEEEALHDGIQAYTKDRKHYKYCTNIDSWNKNFKPSKEYDETAWQSMPETAKEAFHLLWDNIYAKQGYGWDANPWIWIIEFERINHDNNN